MRLRPIWPSSGGAIPAATPETRGEITDMAVHLTPTELADELNMKRREVLSMCIEMNVPVLKGRIDKTLFVSSLRAFQTQDKRATA
jgi:hypothetical protein